MSAEASYSAGWFGLRDYSAEFLDGDLRGDIYFGVTSKRGFDSSFPQSERPGSSLGFFLNVFVRANERGQI